MSFEDKIQKTDTCWIWLGYITKAGYGHHYENGKTCKAHRLAYKKFKGDPGSNMVCHTCDVRRCVNPDHLFLGNAVINNQDRHLKGRSRGPLGAANKSTKLSIEKARQIRQMYATGKHSHNSLKRIFGVAKATIYYILKEHSFNEDTYKKPRGLAK